MLYHWQDGEAQQPQRLSALDADLAPQVPGIYAWYAQLALSEDDWRPRMRGDVDLAAFDLHRAVADYANAHRPEPIHLHGEGSYGLNWAGTIRREAISDRVDDITINRVEAHISEISTDPQNRRLLTTLLRAATPVFASPLYIGVATNLRTRLAQHKADYEQAKAEIRNDPTASARLQFDGDSFGARLAGAGIQLDRLECWVLPASAIIDGKIERQGAGNHSNRSVAQAAEWILQHIFQPVLGRK